VPENNVTLTVVVSGAPQSVRINLHQKVADLMREALREAGVGHGDLAGWSLRFASGGDAISPDARIAESGISAGETLFLDRDAGGGGQIAGQIAIPVPGEEDTPTPPPKLVDHSVSMVKLDRQLAHWEMSRTSYEERGWILLGREDLSVDVAFTARLPIGPFQDLVTVPLAVRIGFENYDLWAPSVKIIDPLTRRWLQIPRLAALDFTTKDATGTPANFFVNGHPRTGHVFLCVPGVREYHDHPEHSGDDWLRYRGDGYGTLASICELLWRSAARTVTGLNFTAQRLAVGQMNSLNQSIELRQEDVDQLLAQAQAQFSEIFAQVPGELQAQLPAELHDQLQGVVDRSHPR
jgi:hypothetical protein